MRITNCVFVFMHHKIVSVQKQFLSPNVGLYVSLTLFLIFQPSSFVIRIYALIRNSYYVIFYLSTELLIFYHYYHCTMYKVASVGFSLNEHECGRSRLVRMSLCYYDGVVVVAYVYGRLDLHNTIYDVVNLFRYRNKVPTKGLRSRVRKTGRGHDDRYSCRSCTTRTLTRVARLTDCPQ